MQEGKRVRHDARSHCVVRMVEVARLPFRGVRGWIVRYTLGHKVWDLVTGAGVARLPWGVCGGSWGVFLDLKQTWDHVKGVGTAEIRGRGIDLTRWR